MSALYSRHGLEVFHYGACVCAGQRRLGEGFGIRERVKAVGVGSSAWSDSLVTMLGHRSFLCIGLSLIDATGDVPHVPRRINNPADAIAPSLVARRD